MEKTEAMSSPPETGRKTIVVKVIGPLNKVHGVSSLARQLPTGFAEQHGLSFTFDLDARDYDWLAVYENLPPAGSERRSKRVETLSCAPENTILFTTEPSGVKIYSSAYTDQFGHVVTSQEPFALRHPGRIWSQAGLRWFYGAGSQHLVTADEISTHFPEKTKSIGTVCSTKRQGHTLHRLRYDFTQAMAVRMPELDVFGHGHRQIDDKASSIDPYKYHIAIENHLAPHHITEKLSDAFLGLSLPFYFGAPNAADYFPADSFIAIDIRKPDEAYRTMQEAIENGEYEKRLPAILEARRLVIEKHNILALIADVIEKNGTAARDGKQAVLKSQRAAREGRPFLAAKEFAFREALHLRNRIAGLLSR
ncbi:glycosyltransferase family 10 domain-containing protein [Pararhizobium arenae]|uniref:glycosyltransferase family 10 domain-containing protein n=1 Tax=Pararhizobium arenae TaxID=1856850 RepID=UPI000A682430|nr:glycosyltransferase family 10 [Pararhizobium arenae]